MDRQRWQANVRSMEIIAKPPEAITDDDIAFLRENYTSTGGLLPKGFNGGAFFTPTHVARFITEAVAGLCGGWPPALRVLEPSVGSGVFLEHLPPDAEVTALELDETSAKVTSLIYPRTNVILGNALEHGRRDYYDLVIGNPPYGETVELADGGGWVTLSKSRGSYRGKSENAFLELAIKAVRPGGYIAYVLPNGIGFSQASAKVRKLMHETCWHVATILLPGEAFVHVGTTIPTQILILRKAPPGTPQIEPATKRWSSNFKRGGHEDIARYNARFLLGQTPSYFAKVTDIGWDAKGRTTDSAQLDELLDDFTDGGLMRENLYPHIPSWHGISKGNDAFFFSHGNDSCDGYRDASRTFADGPYRWNELTLGAGDEIEWGGREWSSWLDGMTALQDELVVNYYAKEAV
ncbi:HsdM family class I SAM-dependent methyltransferase [Brevibacillus panacihumi]|uniref:HsdM family class I SAM-dependent methyltransferase n=1 Tax=Brevibacillus panacihumi TaxID=497735 RepID=UPI003D049827